MKYRILSLLYSIYALSLCANAPQRYAIDQIIAVIYHEDGTSIILHSDLHPGLDGQPRTLRDIIIDQLMVLDALKHKVTVTDEDADRVIENIKKEHKLSQAAVEQLFKNAGYSYEEGKTYLKNRQLIDAILEYRVRSDKRMVIQKQEVIDYYTSHKPIQEATVTLAIAFIPGTAISRKQLDECVAKGMLPEGTSWDDPVTIPVPDLSDDRTFVLQEKPGKIVLVEEVEGGYEITKLVQKTDRMTMPFDDCYNDIVAQLRKERLQIVLNEYQENLLSTARMRFPDPSIHV